MDFEKRTILPPLISEAKTPSNKVLLQKKPLKKILFVPTTPPFHFLPLSETIIKKINDNCNNI